MTAARTRTISGRFFHQGAAGRSLTSFADPARSNGRYHHLGGTGVWYASDQEQACWVELMRHFTDTDLTGDDYAATQAVAAAAIAAGYGGLLAPSAALAGRRTFVLVAVGASTVTAEWSCGSPATATPGRPAAHHPDTGRHAPRRA